ncbi:MAG: MBL fold metallo-hydrolase [Nitriliruptorales bacterium]|nr:MBL fold metallo-hydrolase [Nitriliruptorales bacterium]
MTVQVTVLGCSGTHTGPDRMCSSYMVESANYRLLLDCGNGALSNLQRRWNVADVDAVVISHLHPDHFADLYGLYYALRFHADGPRSVPVVAPLGAWEFASQLLDSADRFAQTCRFETAQAGDRLNLGPFTVTLFASSHPVETLGSRVQAGAAVVAYTGDSGPTAQLQHLARDADLLLADATWLERQRPLPTGVHMTGHEAGTVAAAANVRRLVTTHVFPSVDPNEVAAEAAAAFDGEVVAAHDLQEFAL